jgi:hypothetical protein
VQQGALWVREGDLGGGGPTDVGGVYGFSTRNGAEAVGAGAEAVGVAIRS